MTLSYTILYYCKIIYDICFQGICCRNKSAWNTSQGPVLVPSVCRPYIEELKMRGAHRK